MAVSISGNTVFNGKWQVGPIPLLLDTYSGAAAAYSLRKLRTAYTGSAVRVRRSSDSVEQDIGFDANGNLDETTLQTFCGENLLQRSEEFDNLWWYTTPARITVNSNVINSPILTQTADKLSEQELSGSHYLRGNSTSELSLSNSTVYVYSCFAKFGSSNRHLELLSTGYSSYCSAIFNLSNGTTGAYLNCTPAISDAGNGWYRCSITFTSNTTSGVFDIRITNTTSTTNNSYTGDGSFIYIWGAQLNTGSLKPYVQTTSAARDGMGYVTKWYDQSGNARDAAQTTAANQPRIVNAGVVEKVNGKAACYFDGSNDGFSLPTISSTISNYSIFLNIYNGSTSNTLRYLLDSQTGRLVLASRSYIDVNTSNYVGFYDGNWKASSTNLTTERVLLTYILASSGIIYKNGSSIFSGTYSQKAISESTVLGSTYDLSSASFLGNISEFIIYSSDQSASRTAIESNINTYYQIY